MRVGAYRERGGVVPYRRGRFVSATLWINTANDEALDLGGTLPFYKVISELAKTAGPKYLEEWPSLSSLMDQVESQDDAPAELLDGLSQEATLFLQRHGRGLGEDSVWLLGQLRTLGSGQG